MTFVQGHDTSFDHCQQMCEILSGSKKAVKFTDKTWSLTMHSLWSLLQRYDLDSRLPMKAMTGTQNSAM